MPKEDVDGGKEDLPAKSDVSGAGRRNPPPALLVLIAAFAIAGYFGYQEFQERLVTLHEEDARIRAEMVTISSRVAGWVTAVSAKEGETVEEGTALIVIDDRRLRTGGELSFDVADAAAHFVPDLWDLVGPIGHLDLDGDLRHARHRFRFHPVELLHLLEREQEGLRREHRRRARGALRDG